MLNGKFYTGLPPDMIDRRQRSSNNNNPLQSHLFWPDDTKVDSAVETRVKRRTSFQQADRPRPQQQSSVGDNDVNTRQMFQKEFSKSSIQFYDNLQDNQERRRPLLHANRSNRREITPKPTAMKLELPDDVVNEGYSSAKKKQAFTSKIEFYDDVDDELRGRNNVRAPKMDMNDKRALERNTKNSPKLQVKNNVRNLRVDAEESRANNNNARFRERFTPERSMEKEGYEERVLKQTVKPFMRSTSSKRVSKTPERHIEVLYEDRIIKNNNRAAQAPERNTEEHYEERRMQNVIRPIRKLEYEETYYDDDIGTASLANNYRKAERISVDYEDDVEVPARNMNRPRYAETQSVEKLPKKILRNSINEHERYNDYADYADPVAGDDVDQLEHSLRNVRVRSSPKKHVTYSDELFDDDDDMPTTSRQRTNARRPPIMKTGSHQRPPVRASTDMEHANDDDAGGDCYQFDETEKPLNNNKYNNSNNNNNKYNKAALKSNNNKNNTGSPKSPVASRKIITKMPGSNNKTTITTTKTRATAESSANETPSSDMKKHLRSSLCFHDGEIVANNAGGGGGGGKTPTRAVRNLATQRVSVGLPD